LRSTIKEVAGSTPGRRGCAATLGKLFTRLHRGGVLVRGVQVKRHNFERWESFQFRASRHSVLCVLCVSVDRGVYGLGGMQPRN